MAGMILLGTLAAMGAMSLLWAAFGWLLPSEEGCALVCVGEPDERILWRYRWLKGLGLLRCPLLVVTEKIPEGDTAERCSREELLVRLERERNGEHGTGNGDPPGRSQRRGVSEL